MKILLDTPTHRIEVPDDAIIHNTLVIRIITTQAFYRRLTPSERTLLRRSQQETVADLREDLQLGRVVYLDEIIRDQLIATDLFSSERIDELLVDGVEDET